ncbi:hypothetical protein [Idiomarina abyssalis]|uniref:hypothetical protein n=1 Tax=Idiomarina abyssalis TaxID=86102 RepID=UPI0006C86124|nr:hypothetical protein [Idiomarina abyssalis]KPD20767.1 hypothetical protein ADS78_11095 [Idiomarina abyssalis]SFT58943.1 hypothetical protein SAMN04515657_1244 [Idiomarina abyssalis]
MMDKNTQRSSSYQQLSLPLEVNVQPPFKQPVIGSEVAESNVIDFLSVAAKKENREMAVFREQVLRNVTAYFNL